jgi:hypothetical protein
MTRSAALCTTLALLIAGPAAAQAGDPAVPAAPADHWGQIQTYCTECHNYEDWAGGIAFDVMDPNAIPQDAEIWEHAIRKLRGGMMPPPGTELRPDQETALDLASWLETTIDTTAVNEHVGRVPLHRLNRREYEYAIRDLLALEIDAAALLPADDLKGGYDNIAEALQVSPTFVDQYLTAARTIAHNAIGDRRPIPVMETYGSVADMIISLPPRGIDGTGTQQRHSEGMPFGTRGGMSVTHTFLADGEYELNIGDLALAREVPNMEFENTVVALLDGQEFYRTVIGGELDHKWIDQILDDAVASINSRLKGIRFYATAGQHTVTVTFVQRTMAESDERTRIPALEGGQDRVHGVHALQVTGPYEVTGMGESPSRRKIFVCYPADASEETACAQEIVANLAERAFRRPVTEEDTAPLMAVYESSRQTGDFEAGVRDALSAILVSPHFIYRAENGQFAEPSEQLGDYELASRLSFFLWSSLPDEELLALADEGRLSDRSVLEQQIHRMLQDERSKTLVDDFAAQWLNLRRLDEITPDGRLFGYASRSLDPRSMFKQELSLFIDSVLRSDQSVVRLLDADYTYVNERLAMHYGIEDVKGSRFRRIELDNPARRGLLGKGAILMLTSNPERTSPVVRGAWILERMLGTPPASPPPGVDTDISQKAGEPATTLRERMQQHRTDPSCNSCHGVIDPLGLALENFNGVGQFREYDPNTLTVIDASGVLPDGTVIGGPEDLVAALVARSDMFIENFTENLMTYALGREVEYQDMPTVRRIVRAAAEDDYTFEAIVREVVMSDPFMRRDAYMASAEEASLQDSAGE